MFQYESTTRLENTIETINSALVLGFIIGALIKGFGDLLNYISSVT